MIIPCFLPGCFYVLWKGCPSICKYEALSKLNVKPGVGMVIFLRCWVNWCVNLTGTHHEDKRGRDRAPDRRFYHAYRFAGLPPFYKKRPAAFRWPCPYPS